MPSVTAQQTFKSTIVKAIEHDGRAVVRVTLTKPVRSVALAGIEYPAAGIDAATGLVQEMDEERAQALVAGSIGDFMQRLDDALNANIGEINAAVMRANLRTGKRKPDQR